MLAARYRKYGKLTHPNMKLDSAETKQETFGRIIQNKIIPFLYKIIGPVPNGLVEIISLTGRITMGVEGQYIEESGAAEDGHLLFFESGIAHNFYYNCGNRKYLTTHITKKHDVLLDLNSFLYQHGRTGYIQMLEDGAVFKISYAALRSMLQNFPILNIAFWQLQAEKEKQHLYYQHLLKLSLDERVKTYLDDNPGITSRISNDYIANYLDICRTGFSTAYAKYRNEQGKS